MVESSDRVQGNSFRAEERRLPAESITDVLASVHVSTS